MAAGCLILSLLCPCLWHQRHKNVKWMWEKIPCPLFITLNHFLQISQDHDYWMHLSFSSSTAGQRRIAPAQRFKDFPTPSDRSWQSLILLNANCPLSRVHSRQTRAHTHKVPSGTNLKVQCLFLLNEQCVHCGAEAFGLWDTKSHVQRDRVCGLWMRTGCHSQCRSQLYFKRASSCVSFEFDTFIKGFRFSR